MPSLQPDEWSALLHAVYPGQLPYPPPPPGIDEADALALLAVAPDASTAIAWWHQGASHWPPLDAARQRWDRYCDHVHNTVLGNDQGSNTAVFGHCVRCGSQRVLVTPGTVLVPSPYTDRPHGKQTVETGR